MYLVCNGHLHFMQINTNEYKLIYFVFTPIYGALAFIWQNDGQWNSPIYACSISNVYSVIMESCFSTVGSTVPPCTCSS